MTTQAGELLQFINIAGVFDELDALDVSFANLCTKGPGGLFCFEIALLQLLLPELNEQVVELPSLKAEQDIIFTPGVNRCQFSLVLVNFYLSLEKQLGSENNRGQNTVSSNITQICVLTPVSQCSYRNMTHNGIAGLLL